MKVQSILLANTQRDTTRLGFGCSAIANGFSRRHSLELLETAYDCGIRHFDVAPMYGNGTAEEVVGEFLGRHPGQLTVTTKFGVLPQRRSQAERLVRAAGRRLLQRFNRRQPSGAGLEAAPAAALEKADFTPASLLASLERSRRALRVDAVDLLLLHEAEAGDLEDERLLDTLQTARHREHIRGFGVGSTAALVPELLRRRPEYCQVVQSEWCAHDAPIVDSSSFRITHRAFHLPWEKYRQALLESPSRMSAWCHEVGCDLQDRNVWPRLLFHAALAITPSSVVLFSTGRTERILDNVVAAQDERLRTPALRLHTLLYEQRLQLEARHDVAGSPQLSS